MLKQILTLGIAGLFLASVTSCNNSGGIKRTDAGLMYKIVKDEPGDKHPKIGDIVDLHVKVSVRDSVLSNSRDYVQNGGPYTFQLQENKFKGDFIYGLQELTPGDSAVFYILVDSLKKYQQGQFPEWFKDDDTIVYEAVLIDVKTKEELEQERAAKNAEQLQKDDEALQAYFKENNLNPTKTASGLYYIIDKEGNGTAVEPKYTVTVNYTGKNLKGITFDSNVDPKFKHVEPFKFIAGQGMVIPGWDEGIVLLKKGSKARFFIPSVLAYGPQPLSEDVGPNSCLAFEVEVTDVQKEAPKANQ